MDVCSEGHEFIAEEKHTAEQEPSFSLPDKGLAGSKAVILRQNVGSYDEASCQKVRFCSLRGM